MRWVSVTIPTSHLHFSNALMISFNLALRAPLTLRLLIQISDFLTLALLGRLLLSVGVCGVAGVVGCLIVVSSGVPLIRVTFIFRGILFLFFTLVRCTLAMVPKPCMASVDWFSRRCLFLCRTCCFGVCIWLPSISWAMVDFVCSYIRDARVLNRGGDLTVVWVYDFCWCCICVSFTRLGGWVRVGVTRGGVRCFCLTSVPGPLGDCSGS